MINTFLNNISWLRKHCGLSKKEMAKRLQIGIWTLNKIERGELPPRLSCDIVFSVYKNFGIRFSDLLSRRLEGNDTETDGDCHASLRTGSQ